MIAVCQPASSGNATVREVTVCMVMRSTSSEQWGGKSLYTCKKREEVATSGAHKQTNWQTYKDDSQFIQINKEASWGKQTRMISLSLISFICLDGCRLRNLKSEWIPRILGRIRPSNPRFQKLKCYIDLLQPYSLRGPTPAPFTRSLPAPLA